MKTSENAIILIYVIVNKKYKWNETFQCATREMFVWPNNASFNKIVLSWV